jgi:hypothetical protein
MEYQLGRKAPKRAKPNPKSDLKQKKVVVSRKPQPPTIPSIEGTSADEYGDLTDTELTTVPVPDIIIPALYDAWQINPKHKMCIIFDAINPCRRFKRGHVYDGDLEDPFAEYDPNAEDDPDVTDTDEGETQPYAPFKYT